MLCTNPEYFLYARPRSDKVASICLIVKQLMVSVITLAAVLELLIIMIPLKSDSKGFKETLYSHF